MFNKKQSELIDFIQQSKTFAGLDRKACEDLLPYFEKITLKQGEVLFQQGDPSDSLYILVEGHLVAILKSHDSKPKIIGIIERGETVGELGVLSRRPRMLTVRATADSLLLKLTHTNLEAFFNHPTAIFQLIDTIILRSQSTIKLLSHKQIFKHVAIIQGNKNTPLVIFLENLKRNLTDKFNITLIDDPEANIANAIDQAEKQDKILVFVLTPENEKTLGGKVDHIGSIAVVVDGDRTPKLSPFALEMLKGEKTHFVTQYELILLHDDKLDIPKDTIHWLKLANFTLHHHIKMNDPEGYKRILRVFAGKAVALVLGGGGGKGWASLGALKAVIDAGIPIDAIGGTSVGAGVGAAFAMHLNYEEAFADFKKFVDAASNPFRLRNLTWPIISILSAKRPTELLHEVVQERQIEDLWLPFFAISSNLNTGKEVVHRHGTIWEALRASTAIPGVVPPLVINGQLHIDGGILNNLPIDCMRAMLGEESFIIGVTLSKLTDDTTRYNFPPYIPFRVGFLRKLGLGYKDYVFPRYFNTFIHSLLLGASSKEKANRLMANIMVSPDLRTYRTLQIDSLRNKELIQIGYDATMQQLKEHANELIWPD